MLAKRVKNNVHLHAVVQ